MERGAIPLADLEQDCSSALAVHFTTRCGPGAAWAPTRYYEGPSVTRGWALSVGDGADIAAMLPVESEERRDDTDG
jgi:hypothetical protein